MHDMLSYKEFYIWLEGYLYGKLENKHIDITPIIEKMGQVKDEIDLDTFKHLGRKTAPIFEPITIKPDEYDDLGKPPKIVM